MSYRINRRKAAATLAGVFLGGGVFSIRSAKAEESLAIGNFGPVSGPAAAFGLGVQRGMEFAMEDVGPLKISQKSYRLTAPIYDTAFDPAKTAAALTRAIQNDGVRYGFVIGAGVHPAVLPIIRRSDFLDLAFAAGGAELTNDKNPTVFRIMPSSDLLYSTFVQPIYKKLNVKRVAFIGANSELGKKDAAILKGLVASKMAGTQFLGEEYYQPGSQDFSAALLRLSAQKPDLIDTSGSPTATIALLAKQARELGYTGYLCNSTGTLEAQSIVNIAGSAGDGIVTFRVWAEPPTPLYKQLEDRYRQKYKEDPPGNLWEAYGATRWLAQVLQSAGTVEPRAVSEALGGSSFEEHPFGPAKWVGEATYGIRRQISTPLGAAILKGGRWEEIERRVGVLN